MHFAATATKLANLCNIPSLCFLSSMTNHHHPSPAFIVGTSTWTSVAKHRSHWSSQAPKSALMPRYPDHFRGGGLRGNHRSGIREGETEGPDSTQLKKLNTIYRCCVRLWRGSRKGYSNRIFQQQPGVIQVLSMRDKLTNHLWYQWYSLNA